MSTILKKTAALIKDAIKAKATRDRTLQRTARSAVILTTANKLVGASREEVEALIAGKGIFTITSAIALASALGITARQILDAQTDDQLAQAGDTSARTAAEPKPKATVKSAVKKVTEVVGQVATRTSPSKPASRKREVIGRL